MSSSETNAPSGGIAQCGGRVIWTGDPPPGCWPDRLPRYEPTHTPLPNIYEQLGADPVSKLAAAIDRLAAAIEKQQP